MARIKIVVSVIRPIGSAQIHGRFPTKPGKYFSFTEDVVLEQYDGKRPGRGLPKKVEDRYAGIHSGTVTLLRIAGTGDRFYKPRTLVVQYVATYKFNDLRGTPLKKGEITARGLNLLDGTSLPPAHLEKPNTYALTGGTDAYAETRGQVIELYNPQDERELYLRVVTEQRAMRRGTSRSVHQVAEEDSVP
jgi:hypothetical protein